MTPKSTEDWRRIITTLRGVVLKRGVRGADVDDVIQRALEKSVRNIGALGDQTSFEPWVRQIAVNTAIDHVRAAARGPRVDDVEQVVDLPAVENTADPLLTYTDCIEPFLERLTQTDRHALKLKDLEGLSFDDLAKQLGLTVPGAKSRVQRARRKLARALTECCDTLRGGSVEPIDGSACHRRCCEGEA